MSVSPRRFDQLTGLRFVAAMGIVLNHYAGVLQLPDFARFVTTFLGTFVALFFVLSGFVITHTYGGRLAAPGALKSYFIARVARIVPVYWLGLFGILLLYTLGGFGLSQGGGADYDNKAGSFLVSFVAMQAWFADAPMQQFWNAPGWSISGEMFFYLCFPLMQRWRWLDGSRRSLLMLWLGMAVFLALYFGFCVVAFGAEPARMQVWLACAVRFPVMGLFCFALGIHLARAQRPVAAIARARVASHAVLLCWLLLVLLVSFLFTIQESQHRFFVYLQISALYLVYTPFFYSLIKYLLESGSAAAGFLSRPSMVALGEASYALYILHWLPLCLLLSGPAWMRGSPALAWLAVVGAIAVSMLTFQRFEKPLRNRIRRQYRPKPLAAA